MGHRKTQKHTETHEYRMNEVQTILTRAHYSAARESMSRDSGRSRLPSNCADESESRKARSDYYDGTTASKRYFGG